MEGDDLVAEDVLTRGERLGDSDGPGVAVGDQLVGGPVVGGGVVETLLVDLEERQVARGDGGAVIASALRHVVEDGTVVGLGPGVPLELDLATSGDLGGDSTGLTVLNWKLADASMPRMF